MQDLPTNLSDFASSTRAAGAPKQLSTFLSVRTRALAVATCFLIVTCYSSLSMPIGSSVVLATAVCAGLGLGSFPRSFRSVVTPCWARSLIVALGSGEATILVMVPRLNLAAIMVLRLGMIVGLLGCYSVIKLGCFRMGCCRGRRLIIGIPLQVFEAVLTMAIVWVVNLLWITKGSATCGVGVAMSAHGLLRLIAAFNRPFPCVLSWIQAWTFSCAGVGLLMITQSP